MRKSPADSGSLFSENLSKTAGIFAKHQEAEEKKEIDDSKVDLKKRLRLFSFFKIQRFQQR